MRQLYRADCVCNPFSSVETTTWTSNHDYIIFFKSSSVTAAALTLKEPCKLHPIPPFSYP